MFIVWLTFLPVYISYILQLIVRDSLKWEERFGIYTAVYQLLLNGIDSLSSMYTGLIPFLPLHNSSGDFKTCKIAYLVHIKTLKNVHILIKWKFRVH